MQSLKHILSRKLTTLKADGYTQTIPGSFSISSNVIGTLPTGHAIEVGDRVSFTVATSAVLTENGLVSVTNASGVESGTGVLTIDKAQSLFATLGSIQAAFPAGTLISFQGGFLSGGTALVKNSAALGGVSVQDGAAIGNPGYWLLIFDVTTTTGFPSLSSYPFSDAISPSEDIYVGVNASVNYSGLPVSAVSSTTATVTGIVPDNTFTDLTVQKHSRIVGPLITEEIETDSLKVQGAEITAQLPSIPYSGVVNDLKLLWKGYDNLGNTISEDKPNLAAVTPTDVFNVGTDISIIQLLNHPINKDIVVMIYQNLIDSLFYIKCFKYVYETGFDDSYTPFLLSGVDSTDIRADFSVLTSQATGELQDPLLIILGGKSSPGNSIYGAVVSVNTTSLTISDSGLFPWGDTSLTTSVNSFVTLGKISCFKQILGLSPITTRFFVVLYNNTNLASLDYSTASNTFSLNWDLDNPTYVNNAFEYHGNNSSTVIVVGNNTITTVNATPGIDKDVAGNNFSIMKSQFTGTLNASLTLFRVDRYSGVGGQTFGVESNGDIQDNVSNVNYEVIPHNFQNSSGKFQNKVFEIGKDKILFYQSFGYYVLCEKHTGKLLYIGRSGSSNINKDDFQTTIVNDSTVLRYTGSAWSAVKFLTEGPYLAYKKSGNDALIANDKSRVTTDFNLVKGATYYWGYTDNFIQTTPTISIIPAFASRRLGTALTTNILYVDFDMKMSPSIPRIVSNIQKDVTPIASGFGNGYVLLESAGKISQDTALQFSGSKLGVGLGAAAEFGIQTSSAVVSGISYTSGITSGTIDNAVSGDSNGLTFNPTADITLTGIANGFSSTSGNRFLTINNTSNDYSVIIKHNDSGSSSLNRITTPTGDDYIIPPRGWVLLIGTSGGWFVFEKPISAPIAITGGGTVAVILGYKDKLIVNPTSSITLNLSSPIAGSTYAFVMKQGATPYTIGFSQTIKWKGGTAYTATNSANAIDIVTLFYDGTNYYGTFGTGYA